MRAGLRWLIVAALAWGAIPAVASAAPATVKGTFAGPGLPDAGEGVTGVRAVDLETGVVAGTDYTGGRRGRWRFVLAPAPYALGAAAVPFEGGKAVNKLVAFVGARSGDTETLKLRLKPKRRNRAAPAGRAARGGSGIGDVSVDHPAIWVKETVVQSQDPDMGVLRKGMTDMLVSDLVAGFGGPEGCLADVVERARINDILNEHRIQQLPGFDPNTTITPGRLIRDNASVSTTLTESGGHVTLTSTYTDRRRSAARSRTVTVQGPGESIFDLEQQLAQKLVQAICSDGLPDVYSGTFDGKSVNEDGTFSWNGTVTLTRMKPPNMYGAECKGRGVACYEVTGGLVTWQVSTTPGAECTYHSEPKTVALFTDQVPRLYVDGDGSENPGYSGGWGVFDSGPGTSQCPGGDPEDQTYLLSDCCVVMNTGTPWGDFGQNGGSTLSGTSSRTNGVITVTNSWNLTGQ